jgi:hypothetical protein
MLWSGPVPPVFNPAHGLFVAAKGQQTEQTTVLECTLPLRHFKNPPAEGTCIPVQSLEIHQGPAQPA